jgi:2-oxoglutarate dehydrogenase E1 component
MSGFLNDQKPVRTLREILKQMRTAYCGNIGFEVLYFASLNFLRVGC